ncbi:Uncharacterised protein [Acinetobacter baumannii]|nr:Uncharacterised protein [Acinetobacter baumannii]
MANKIRLQPISKLGVTFLRKTGSLICNFNNCFAAKLTGFKAFGLRKPKLMTFKVPATVWRQVACIFGYLAIIDLLNSPKSVSGFGSTQGAVRWNTNSSFALG